MNRPQALIIDDEPDIRELLELTLNKMGIEVKAAKDLNSAYQFLEDQSFDLCLADMRLPDGDGLEIVEHIGVHLPQLPVAVITAHGNMETAVEALKRGAFDFVSKPVDLPILRNLVDTALRLSRKSDQNKPSDEKKSPLLGTSSQINAIREMIKKLGRSQAPVHISGESGTGKELAARLIHDHSAGANNAFIGVNCGAIPHELIESELFGHKKGSFTGAIDDKQGLFQAASGGTLFLDEIADLPIALQVKLLRAIQEKSIRPIGSTEELPVDVRVISATHRDLAKLVAKGNFRQDLFYRLNVIELTMPPLRERTEDILELARYILGNIAEDYGESVPQLSKQAVNALLSYSFPGNVRELENILERAFALSESDVIAESDLGLSSSEKPTETNALPERPEGENLESYLERLEGNQILSALERSQGNQTMAAEELGISPRSLRYKIQKLGL
ncbi:MAG: sigma-54-dependent transcriptional regulator [bacterium]